MKNKKRWIIILIVLVIILCSIIFLRFRISILGAFSFGIPLSSNSPHWGGYNPNQEYILQEDVFLVRDTMFGRLPVKEYTYLMCGSSSKYGRSPYYFGYNESIESYKKGINDIILNDELEEVKVLGIIKNGTTIISNKLIEYHLCSLFFGCGITYEISGEILDGEFAGKKINDFKGVSIFQPGRLVDIQSFSPQPGLLKIKT